MTSRYGKRAGKLFIMSSPLAYFLTWTTYGTWLPGDVRGWVSRDNSAPGSDFNPPSPPLEQAAHKRMKFPELRLAPAQRRLVEQAIARVCRFRDWKFLAANCRTSHVHVVVSCGAVPPGPVLTQFEAYATRLLRERGDFNRRRVWTRGGSKRYVNTEGALAAAIDYVRNQ